MLNVPKFVPRALDDQIAETNKKRGGPAPRRAKSEADVERYLVKRVKALGGEVRKVSWIGRKGAPDRLVMLPPMPYHSSAPIVYHFARTIWIEVKAPGRAIGFPCGAHEHAQRREHQRMRKMGQRVEVVDSYERVDEVLS